MKGRGRGKVTKNTPISNRSTPLISNTPRDSDASFYSNASTNPPSSRLTFTNNVPSDRSLALRTINSYLSSHSAPFYLKPPLPSARDITDTLIFLLNRLDYPTAPNSKLDEDLPLLLKVLNCPIKLNKSALKAPGTPHAWPSLLGVIHWLVQIASYNELITSSTSTSTRISFLQEDKFLAYTLDSYAHYIVGDEDYVEALDEEFVSKMVQENKLLEENNVALEKEVEEMGAKVERMRAAPSARVVLEKEKGVLEDDVRKFHAIIDGVKSGIATLEKGLEEKEKELETMNLENVRICEEKEELLKMIEGQKFNVRDAERMKRELQGVERDIAEAEVERNAWEEKSWDLDTEMGQKLKELESISVECNQAIRRLKLGNDLQYALNPKGSTPADVLGIDYKLKLKPASSTFADELKKSSVTKYEEFISLQHESRDNAAKLDLKRNRLTELQSQIDAVESRLDLLKRETEGFLARCAAEAKTMAELVERDAYNLETAEKEAEETLKMCNKKLEETRRQTDEEIQMCARELLMLTDSVTKYKENMEPTVLTMKKDLLDTVEFVSNAHKHAKPASFGMLNYETSQ
ncbi:hypothetical protein GIB67_043116 [Kingdonia uniflora]|uniref:Kinetochore protein NDC80 n=1 Tax=Kingdonia uniflora TaxID=39325 RepID=A0A7J7NJ90_9MAGN|nr:hypothetical protein GIB67_043116 [Kingdonia uniflora]